MIGATYKTKAAMAVDALRSAILDGEFAPGDRLVLSSLTGRLGMSSTPVRDALKELEAEGLVRTEPHVGAVVADYGAVDVSELFVIRAHMEALATRLAVPRLEPARISGLEALHRDFEEAVHARDTNRLTKTNAAWHASIYRASDSVYLSELIQRVWMPFHQLGLWVDNRPAESLAEHGSIMAAIEARDETLASNLMQDHILKAHQSMLDRLRQAESSDPPSSPDDPHVPDLLPGQQS